MQDQLKFFSGGFPLSTERFQTMQECWQGIMTALMAAIGNSGSYVVTGCGTNGNADGYIVINGELLEHKAGKGNIGVAIMKTEETLTNEDGESIAFRTHRYAQTFANAPTSNTNYDGTWVTWDTINKTAFYPLLKVASEMTGNSAFQSLQSAVSALQTKVAALEAASGSTSADLSAITNNLVKKGTIIATGQMYPTSPASASAVVSSLGDLYGYVPCHSFTASGFSSASASTRKTYLSAWNGYFEEIGLPSAARFSTSATSLDFPSILSAAGLPKVDLSARFPLGADPSGSHALLSTGGEETHTLTASEIPTPSLPVLSILASQGASSTTDGSYVLFDAVKKGSATARTIRTPATSTALAHNNMPPYQALIYYMKAV